MALRLKAEARTGTTKSEIKQLRREGKVPAVVYGKNTGSVQLSVNEKGMKEALRTNRHGVIDLEVPQIGTFPVIIHDVQRHPIQGQLLHIDFHQINMDEPIRTMVGIEFTGEPLGVGTGGMLQIQMHEVEIKCLPSEIPHAITVDISGLAIGDLLTVEKLQLPSGVEMKSNPHDVIVTVLASHKEAVEIEEAKEKEGVKEGNPEGSGV